MSEHLPEVRRLRALGWGNRRIGAELGIGKDAAQRLLKKIELEDALAKIQLPAVVSAPVLPALSFYDTARQALARAKTLAEVKEIGDMAAGMQEAARRLNDKQLELDAAEMRIRAKWELGRRLIAVKETTGLSPGGRPSKTADGPSTVLVPTLADLHINERQSSESQKLAKTISEKAIEARVGTWRKNAEQSERVTVDILKPMPSRTMNRVEAADSLDPFFTPPWATRALCEAVLPHVFGLPVMGIPRWSVWEPACGEGHMAEVLKEYFSHVAATDIHDYGYGNGRADFLLELNGTPRWDWIITNPPFRGDKAERFVLRALDLATVGVAMFVALQFLESVGRYERIFKDRPPTLISFFSERVPCLKGRFDPDASSDAAYIWLVWVKDRAPMAPFWIPPGQRVALTHPDDRARFAAWSMPKNAEAAE